MLLYLLVVVAKKLLAKNVVWPFLVACFSLPSWSKGKHRLGRKFADKTFFRWLSCQSEQVLFKGIVMGAWSLEGVGPATRCVWGVG